MKGKRSRSSAVGALLVLTLAVTACERGAVTGDQEQAQQGPIKVALISDISGAVSLFGEANVNAVRMAVDELNRDGGVLGRRVNLLIRDSKADPEVGVQLTRDAILRDRVDAIFGPVSSGVAAAMSPVAEQNKTPIFFHTSNTAALTTDLFHPYSFMVVPNTLMEGRGNAIDLADEPYQRWAVIAPDYEFGHVQSDAFVDTLRELNPNVEIVKRVYPALGEEDFTSFITSVLAARPDAVYSALFAGDLITFTKQAEPLGFFDQTFFTSLYETDALQALGQDAPEGVRGYSRAPFFAINTPAAQQFVDAYRQRFNKYPSDWAIMAYDAVKLWAAGAEQAGSVEPDALVRALEGIQFDSLRGPFTIRPVDHQATVPVYSGTVTFTDQYDFAVWTEVNSIPADQTMLPEDEVRRLQQER